jgi:hypothetical protein
MPAAQIEAGDAGAACPLHPAQLTQIAEFPLRNWPMHSFD